MAILNKYKRYKQLLRIVLDKYYDFVLSQDDTPSLPYNGELTKDCLSVYIDTEIKKCISGSSLISDENYSWEDAISNGSKLYDIGFTGVDNGYFNYDKYRITNKEFVDIFFNSKLSINSGDTTFKLNQVSGNTQMYSYDSELISESGETYYKLSGGFLQGFYKLFNFDYQVLPQYIENGWNIELVIRPKNYTESGNTLNTTHTDTDGIIFYMGTRAENKFLQWYNCDLSEFDDRPNIEEINFCDKFENGYLIDKTISDILVNDNIEKDEKRRLIMENLLIYQNYFPSELSKCGCLSDKPKENNIQEVDECSSYNKSSAYTLSDISLDDVNLITSEGNSFNAENEIDVETDNKFLTFDRTKYGFTVDTYDENAKVVFTIDKETDENKFLTYNRTKTGKTIGCSEELSTSSSTKNCDVYKDIKGNAFAVRVKEDGSVGYRYFSKDCDAESGYSIIEEYSYSGMVKPDEWNVINIKFQIINGTTDDCGKPYGTRKMKIYIYVNGYLKLVSKELNEFSFRELSETYEKQEGVPFNISVGGGTQGLCDTVSLKYMEVFDKILPLEKNFAGTFIGDIRSFKFYTCPLEYAQIKNNYLYEISKNG